MVISMVNNNIAAHNAPQNNWNMLMRNWRYSLKFSQILSGNAIISSILPYIAMTIYRLIYDATLETTPNVTYFLTSALYIVACIMNIVLFSQRKLIRKAGETYKAEEAEDEGKQSQEAEFGSDEAGKDNEGFDKETELDAKSENEKEEDSVHMW